MEKMLTDTRIMLDYVPGDGFLGYEHLNQQTWLWDDNGTLKAMAIGTTGTVGFQYIVGGTNGTDKMLGLVWEAAAGNDQRISRSWTLPFNWKRDGGMGGRRSTVEVWARVRKAGSGSDNADLTAVLFPFWHNPTLSNAGVEADGDTAFNCIGGDLSAINYATGVGGVIGKTVDGTALVPTAVAVGTEAGFRWMRFDIGDAMTDAQIAALRAGTSFTFKLTTNEDIGANLALEIMGDPIVFYTRHLQPENPYVKGLAWHA